MRNVVCWWDTTAHTRLLQALHTNTKHRLNVWQKQIFRKLFGVLRHRFNWCSRFAHNYDWNYIPNWFSSISRSWSLMISMTCDIFFYLSLSLTHSLLTFCLCGWRWSCLTNSPSTATCPWSDVSPVWRTTAVPDDLPSLFVYTIHSINLTHR